MALLWLKMISAAAAVWQSRQHQTSVSCSSLVGPAARMLQTVQPGCVRFLVYCPCCPCCPCCPLLCVCEPTKLRVGVGRGQPGTAAASTFADRLWILKVLQTTTAQMLPWKSRRNQRKRARSQHARTQQRQVVHIHWLLDPALLCWLWRSISVSCSCPGCLRSATRQGGCCTRSSGQVYRCKVVWGLALRLAPARAGLACSSSSESSQLSALREAAAIEASVEAIHLNLGAASERQQHSIHAHPSGSARFLWAADAAL